MKEQNRSSPDVAGHESDQALLPAASRSPEMERYYADRGLLVRNVALISFLTIGWSVCFSYVNPLLILGLKGAGMSDEALGIQGSINSWLYGFLVMYFGWKSDRTITRFGRRIPYLFISAPIIIGALVLFPFFHNKWIMAATCILQSVFLDIKAATIPLLNIDCVPRRLLGRVNAAIGVAVAVFMFFALRYAMALSDKVYYLPFLLGAGLLVFTTTSAFLIKEPPLHVAARPGEHFRPWSTLKIVWQSEPIAFFLFAGITLLQGFTVMTWSWLTLFAAHDLHMSRTELGNYSSWAIFVPMLLSFPAGWLIDRYRGMRLLYFYIGMALLAAGYVIFHMKAPFDLTVVTILVALYGMFYSAADIKVYREVDPKDVGSFTSTNSCLRGLGNGAMIMVSGFIVEKSGDHYQAAFIFGAVMSVIGFLLLVLHDFLKKRKLRPEQEPVPVPEQDQCGASGLATDSA